MSCVINNPCHLESMCLACPVSNNFICLTVNGQQVLCLTDCGPLLPACGLDNCDWWVLSTSKGSVVLSGTSNHMETVATTWLLETGHCGRCRGLYTILAQTHATSSNSHTHTPIRWVGRHHNNNNLPLVLLVLVIAV